MNAFKNNYQLPVVAYVMLLVSCHAVKGQENLAQDSFVREVVPFLKSHCYECHNSEESEGGIAFDQFPQPKVQKNYDLWEQVIRLVNEHQMPPAD